MRRRARSASPALASFSVRMDNDMDDRTRFRLRITAYTPDTIPMARLAEYMRSLADLMGSAAHVHFRGVTKGSTVVQAEVEAEDAPKVEQRLRAVSTHNAAADALKAVRQLETLLREDGARGSLFIEGGERIIKFLGIDAIIAERVGPIRESTTVEGEVVRVGGKDRTLHALLVSSEGTEFKVTTTSRDKAKGLAGHLFATVRATGTGVWYRDESGEWELDELKLEDFEPVEGRSLVEAVAELRAVGESGWKDVPDPLAALRDLRKH